MGKILHLLEDIRHIDLAFDRAAHPVAEDLLDLVADHKDHFAEAGSHCVVHGVVDDQLAVGSNGVGLLEPTVATPDPGREDDDRAFGHDAPKRTRREHTCLTNWQPLCYIALRIYQSSKAHKPNQRAQMPGPRRCRAP